MRSLISNRLPIDQAVFFRDQFRSARAVALGNAEGFGDILFALERLGSYLMDEVSALSKYEPYLSALAAASPLTSSIPAKWRKYHPPFGALFDAVRDERNSALHQGAFARHLTTHAIQLALILEDALMNDAKQVSEYMVRDVTCAYEWEPISFVRQQMLANSFSFLPIFINSEGGSRWQLISDAALVSYLTRKENGRRKTLASSVRQAIDSGLLGLAEAQICSPEDQIEKVVSLFNGRPLLAVQPEHNDVLLGIVTAFDLL